MSNNQTVELFAGTKSFSKVAKKKGYKTFTIDNDPELKPDLVKDILGTESSWLGRPFILWASPPCQSFSVCTISKNWKKFTVGLIPKSEQAKKSIMMVRKTLELIKESKPTFFFIENPRGMMRKMRELKGIRRVTVSYCQYGDFRMKPTDIWTNHPTWKGKICAPSSPCHEASPRGSKGGTQGLFNAKERGRIPERLFYEIIEACESVKENQEVLNYGTL